MSNTPLLSTNTADSLQPLHFMFSKTKERQCFAFYLGTKIRHSSAMRLKNEEKRIETVKNSNSWKRKTKHTSWQKEIEMENRR
jgi:hypothetical protein